MKKRHLLSGFAYLLVGLGCLLAALLTSTSIESLLYGLAGAGIAPGLLILWRYFYWSRHETAYQEKCQQEEIELKDELKEKLRDQSGRYTYLLGLIVIAIAIPVFVLLEQLQLLQSSFLMIGFLCAYLIFQYAAGIVIYQHLLKKYE